MSGARPTIHLKAEDLVPSDEDREIEVAIVDALVPCRVFAIDYKVAVLGQVSPSLEFLLRVVKSNPGMSEGDCASFFGYSQGELEYVLEEACVPDYLQRRDGRLWLTSSGDALFRTGEREPLIFVVEVRRGKFGFDLLSFAPQRRQALDGLERQLPELRIEDEPGAGTASDQVRAKFGRFFHELGERRDREQTQRRDLYSVDNVTADERFQVTARIRVMARASTPSLSESDLRSWKSDQELADRPQIERAAANLVETLRASRDHRDGEAYSVLADLAPEFLRDFLNKDGLNVRRYWREAVNRAGEVRIDRPTVPVVGSLLGLGNIERLSDVLDYGLGQRPAGPGIVVAVAPLIPHWAATTRLRDMLTLVRRKLQASGPDQNDVEVTCRCFHPGEPPGHVVESFDDIDVSDQTLLPPRLELLLVPGVMVAAVVHAPIGAQLGQPVPLGFMSFDRAVLDRAGSLLSAHVFDYVQDVGIAQVILNTLERREAVEV